jgi:chromosome segregation ATPase
MDDIVELERRITAALMRIDRGLEQRTSAGAVADAGAPVATLADGVAEAEIARLNEALDEERMVSAQLNERLRKLRDQGEAQTAPLEAEIARLNRLLDAQGLEMQRLKQTVVSLREQLRALTEAQAEGRVEPHLINKAVLTELEALRSLRAAEAAELEEIIAALDPLAAPASGGAATKEGADA